MKPYLTSFMRATALLMLICSLSFFTSGSSYAQCKFTISTVDSTWLFSAAAGSVQTRTLTITNTSDSTVVITAGIVSGTGFGLNHDQFTILSGDTASLEITFEPSLGTTATLITDILRIATSNSDCRHYLTLAGTVTGANNGGGDKVVLLDPSSYVFGPIAAGTDTCHTFYLVNHTGVTVTISMLKLVGTDAFSMDPAFNGATIDSGGYYKFSICFKGSTVSTRIVDSIIALCQYGGASHSVEGQILGYTSTPPPPVVIVADPHSFDFGNVPFGTQTCKDVVVTNKSNSTVVLKNWSKCDNTDFSVTPAFTNLDTLAAGASITLNVCYKPHAQGVSGTCSIAIGYFELSPVADGQISVYLTGYCAQDSNNNPTTICLHTEQGSNSSDPIIVGTTATHTLRLINNSNYAITVDSIFIDGSNAHIFTVTTQLPVTVPANTSNMTISYTFAPTSNNNGSNVFTAYALLMLSGDSLGCASIKGVLVGYLVHSNISQDSTVRPLYPDEHRTLAIEGSGNNIGSTFNFTNNLGVDVTVSNIYLDDYTYFSIASYSPNPTPFVLHPGNNMEVTISLNSKDNLVHHATLKIDASHNLLTQTFDLQGLNQSVASVSAPLPVGVEINLTPNPATSYVNLTMSGVNSADVQVYDLLGQPVASSKANASWKWDASTMTAGTYIIRVAGVSTNGENFVTSKRVIVTK
jgi:hypothetical protein